MRKFLIGVLTLFFLFLGIWYAVYYQGFYLKLHRGEALEIPVKIEEKQFFVETPEGEWEPFTVKGVSVNSSLPGRYFSDYAADEETYNRWFSMIREMGANTVWVSTIMDDEFYNALYESNKGQDKPLYLLQGISVSDYANNSSQDAYGGEYFNRLVRDATSVVDVVHGRKNISVNRLNGSGSYRKDISPWVLGYVVGLEWEAGVIAYTDHSGNGPQSFEGKYFSAKQEASRFEVMLARVMDHLTAYETEKYNAQRPVAFINDPQNDPFEYEQEYGRQIAKYNCLDAEHVTACEAFEAGYFAAYRLYEFCDGSMTYFSEQEKKRLGAIVQGLDKSAWQGGYIQLLSEYHELPVLITGYGFSTSRGLVTEQQTSKGPLSEEEQGRRLVEVYQEIVDAGCMGGVISDWHDTWGRKTWNTSYAVDLADYVKWHDLQTDGQGYGLLAFEPGQEERVCYMDGDDAEWAQEQPVLERGAVKLFIRFDAEGLYLLIKGISPGQKLYLPFDITPRTGSTLYASRGLSFSRPADFLLCLAGQNDSRLLVQARYESVRENYLMESEGKDPFVDYPAQDSPDFVPVRMLVLPREQILEEAVLEDRRNQGRYPLWETGRLWYGNGNPAAEDYDSRADFCFGPDCAEVRLPWALLNFADPSEGQIHDDYYENYGVRTLTTDKLWVGLSDATGEAELKEELKMESFSVPGWRLPEFHERLKESYDIVKQAWTEQGPEADSEESLPKGPQADSEESLPKGPEADSEESLPKGPQTGSEGGSPTVTGGDADAVFN